MSTTVEQIVADALALPTEARAFLAERLIESLDLEPGAELSTAWREEILRRSREIDADQVELRDAEDVFDQAFAALG